MAKRRPTSVCLSEDEKRRLRGFSDRLGIKRGAAIGLAILLPEQLIYGGFLRMPTDEAQAHADLTVAHQQLGEALGAGPSAVNWQAILQIIITILQSIGPLFPVKP
jgi:hypothetical protein